MSLFARSAPVVVSTAVQRDVPVNLEQIGKSVAPEVVSIRPEVAGQIWGEGLWHRR